MFLKNTNPILNPQKPIPNHFDQNPKISPTHQYQFCQNLKIPGTLNIVDSSYCPELKFSANTRNLAISGPPKNRKIDRRKFSVELYGTGSRITFR